MLTKALASAHLRSWIGREEIVDEVLTRALVERFHATLALTGAIPDEGDRAPGLIHFCLCQPAVPMAEIGDDGHPQKGSFLPPVPLPRRMWAGSELRFHEDLLVGDKVRRISRIADVATKEGRTGTLCFVTVDHRIECVRGLAVEDRQTVVYRKVRPGGVEPSENERAPRGQTLVTVTPSPVLLFRYSALTFNAHRIHYDQTYATKVEKYPGLVVHGPLQATLLFHLALREKESPPREFRFRSLSPLFETDQVELHAAPHDGGSMSLWTSFPGGPVAMQAEAEWQ